MPVDSSVLTDAAGPVDAAEPPPDAGGCWEAVLLTTVCDVLEGPAGRALTITLEGCYCGEELTCTGDIEGDVVRLSAELDTCPRLLCDGCHKLQAACDLGGDVLGGGGYRVEINGHPGFSLPDLSDPSIKPQCYNPAPVPDSALICGYADGPLISAGSHEVCVPERSDSAGAFVVRSTACVGCFQQPAGCEIYRERDGYRVVPLIRDCNCPTCGVCSGECHDQDFLCELPALPAGTHQVRINSETHTIEIDWTFGIGNRECAD